MRKLLIVDDEPMMRTGLREAIDWEKYGIELAGEADNGQSALKKAMQLNPDIVICDIKMPVKDGIGFLVDMRSIMPSTRIILLTGYADQRNLLSAIRYHVDDFLVKPVTQEQILDAVLRICDTLEKEEKEIGRLRDLGNFVSENRTELKEKVLMRMLTGQVTQERMASYRDSLSLNLKGPYYTLLLFRGEPESWWQITQHCAVAFSCFQPEIVFRQEEFLAVLILNSAHPLTESFLASFCNLLMEYACGRFFISDSVLHPKQLGGRYEACLAWSRRSIYFPHKSRNQVFGESLPEYNPQTVFALEEELIKAVRQGFPVRIAACVDDLFDTLIRMKPENTELMGRLNHLKEVISLIVGVEHEEPWDEYGIRLEEIRRYFHTLCFRLNSIDARYNDIPIRRALWYIRSHYMENLSLETVAEKLCISPSYLSRILNEKTEYGFGGWLHYFRIEAAKELLLTTDLKHYEIAERVGYASYKKFAEHFMDQTGSIAKEFRNSYKKTRGGGGST